MIADDGTFFRALTNGWVPWSVLVGPDGTVVFSENEFDEAGFAGAIEQMYERPATASAKPAGSTSRRATGGPRQIVVLGGGIGGLVAARELRRLLPAEHRVVLVDRAKEHLYQPSLLWQMVGTRSPSQFTRPLERLERKGIDFRNADALELDLEGRVVVTSDSDHAFDSLVLSPGVELAPEKVRGLDEMGYDLYATDGCARIHEALRSFTEGVVGILVPELPFKCPAAPYEAAFLAEAFLRNLGVRRNVELHLFTPEHAPMPVAPRALGDAIEDLLAARGIRYHPLFTFRELRPGSREVVASTGEAHQVDLLMVVPPHRAPEVVRSSPLLGLSGFVHVDAMTLETEHEGVFAIGDVTTIKLANGKALPKAGVFAHSQAKVVARRIAAATGGTAPTATFDGRGYCWIELGDGRAAFAGGDFFAEPEPRLRMRGPGRALHWGKVGFEKWWLRRWP